MEVFSCKNATNNVSVRSSIFELFDLNDGHLENRTREIIITRSIKNGCFAGKKCYLHTKQNQFITNQIWLENSYSKFQNQTISFP